VSRWKVIAAREQSYELVVEAESEGMARAIARQAIEEGSRPDGLVEFFDDESPLDIWAEEAK
jgi:hypothetical protein